MKKAKWKCEKIRKSAWCGGRKQANFAKRQSRPRPRPSQRCQVLSSAKFKKRLVLGRAMKNDLCSAPHLIFRNLNIALFFRK